MRASFALALLLCGLIMCDEAEAQPKGYLYDEAKVPEYQLPELLVSADGAKITTADQWQQTRRPEIMALLTEHMFGAAPGKPDGLRFEVIESADDALGGKAIRKQVAIFVNGKADGPRIDLLIYLPKSATKATPVFAGLNFRGNHSINADKNIRIPKSWMRSGDHIAKESERGTSSSRWPVEMIVDRGYGLATAYYGDIDPDYHDEFKNGVHALYPKTTGKDRPANAWGSIAAWSWGLSRIMDYFETDKQIDAKHVALLGHSRLGKTSLWGGATDERFAIVISNDSGCGGAALSRRAFGETVKRINTSFPHWFCRNFHQYNDNESKLPIDQHMLIAAIAPRPVYVASAVGDSWADPRGEYLSAWHAGKVYELFGHKGLPQEASPAIDHPVGDRVGYHIRSGKHDVTDFDWKQYLSFADRHFKAPAE